MFQDIARWVARRRTEKLRTAATAACLCTLMASVHAAAPQLTTQAPGSYRLMFGDC